MQLVAVLRYHGIVLQLRLVSGMGGGEGVWTGSSWLRIGTDGGARVNAVMNLRVS